MFERVHPVRAYERIVEQIESAVFEGRLAPGDRLPSERMLSEQFGVSRGTVREALRVLRSRGLVDSRHGDRGGPVVLPFTTDALKDALSSLALVEGLSLGELLQFRMLTEGCANQLAAVLRTEAELARLEESISAMEAALARGHAAFSAADMAFHDLVAEIAGNRLLRISDEVVRSVVLRLMATKIEQAPNSEAQMRDSVRRHRLVLDAVAAGDSAGAAALARRHLFEYYADYLTPPERTRAAALLDGEEAHY
ncbi:DNA-binding FadR family transcriptional regulator [Spinactinospora alkalitolerans]|uniref:DNA-binding FadR family transcriptional regulator n=1 Tax=Spinactinospora alkalitolerans TaxID=687207 RepID=A0A852TUE5_9ACTN|nr:DNA-binding FadR family transcriptional regulator [Spinactinospora alkalitolerans]